MPAFHVQRSIEIDAPPEQVFDAVTDYRTWTTWSPWLCAEPDATVNVTDNANSVGAVYSWQGKVVGQGEIEHRKLDRPRTIEDEIRFKKPFKSMSSVTFQIEAAGQGSRLHWNMHGSMPWFLFWMIPSMKTFIGMDYERGLKMLKEWIETGQILSSTSIRNIVSVDPIHVVGQRVNCHLREISSTITAAFSNTDNAFANGGLPDRSDGITVTTHCNFQSGQYECVAGFIVCEPPANLPNGLDTITIPRTTAFCVEHVGSYENLGNAWSTAHQHLRYRKLKQSKIPAFEIYRNSPHETQPAELRTEVYIPLR